MDVSKAWLVTLCGVCLCGCLTATRKAPVSDADSVGGEPPVYPDVLAESAEEPIVTVEAITELPVETVILMDIWPEMSSEILVESDAEPEPGETVGPVLPVDAVPEPDGTVVPDVLAETIDPMESLDEGQATEEAAEVTEPVSDTVASDAKPEAGGIVCEKDSDCEDDVGPCYTVACLDKKCGVKSRRNGEVCGNGAVNTSEKRCFAGECIECSILSYCANQKCWCCSKDVPASCSGMADRYCWIADLTCDAPTCFERVCYCGTEPACSSGFSCKDTGGNGFTCVTLN